MSPEKTARKQARSAKPDSKAVTAPYEPSQAERVALDAVLERRRARSSAPRFKVEKKGKTTPTQVVIDHPEAGRAREVRFGQKLRNLLV